jgi:hypothetical protein
VSLLIGLECIFEKLFFLSPFGASTPLRYFKVGFTLDSPSRIEVGISYEKFEDF